MSKLAAAQALAAQVAATGPDMTEEQKGGTARLLPPGYAFARLVEYVEFGNQPQTFEGKAKEPALEAQLGFALYDTADRKYSNDDGTPYILRPYAFAVARNAKSRAFKLFKALNWQGTRTHFAQMLGEAFLVKIVHVSKSKTDNTQVSRIDLDSILPPLDAASQMPYPVPAARDEDIRLFSWDHPTIEAWDELFVDGKWDDGRSKNRVQETILGATDFAGSALETLLKTSGKTFVVPVAKQTAPAQGVTTPALPQAAVTPGNAIGVVIAPASQSAHVAVAMAPSVMVAAPPAVGGVAEVPFVPAVAPPPPASTLTSVVQPVGVPPAPIASVPTTSPSSPAVPAMPALPTIPGL